MADNSKWYGPELVRYIKSGMTKNLTAAGTHLMREVKAVLNTSGRTVTESTTKDGKPKRVRGKKGSNPSLPGEAPHKQTGKLRRDVFKRLIARKTKMRVGTTAPHGGMLEFGTRNMAARPYLRNTLAKNESQIGEILTKPIQ